MIRNRGIGLCINVAEFIDPDWGDKVVVPARYATWAAWRAGTTTLCRGSLNSATGI
jgi:hypothetical protein